MNSLNTFALLILICSALVAQPPQSPSLNLDGDGDYMQLSYYADSLIFAAPVTIEFWLRPNFDHKYDTGFIWNLNNGNPIATSNAGSFELRYGSNTSGLYDERLTIFYSLGTLANSNSFGVEDHGFYSFQWHHYAFVADSVPPTIYILMEWSSL